MEALSITLKPNMTARELHEKLILLENEYIVLSLIEAPSIKEGSRRIKMCYKAALNHIKRAGREHSERYVRRKETSSNNGNERKTLEAQVAGLLVRVNRLEASVDTSHYHVL